jgi:uncharacterized protein YkwD
MNRVKHLAAVTLCVTLPLLPAHAQIAPNPADPNAFYCPMLNDTGVVADWSHATGPYTGATPDPYAAFTGFISGPTTWETTPAGPKRRRITTGPVTDAEQYNLELINRARANPVEAANLYRYTTDPDVVASYGAFGVDLAQMYNQISVIVPAPPVAMHSVLRMTAYGHACDQVRNSFQGHAGSDGTSPPDRATRAGYGWSAFGENSFTSAKSTWHGHVGFDVDWGSSVYGMQTPPGHRNIIHSGAYREVGLAIIEGVNGTVGPMTLTQEFGSRYGLHPMVTGVVYYDINNNNLYDMSEGIGNVTVRHNLTPAPPANPGFNQDITPPSGGYRVSLPGNGTYTVTFEKAGMATQSATFTVSNGTNTPNTKHDVRFPYTPPVITPPASLPPASSPLNFSATTVAAADLYQWQRFNVASTNPVMEGAEPARGLGALTAALTGTYAPTTTYHKYQAPAPAPTSTASFRLAQPTPVDQTLTFTNPFYVESGASIWFATRLHWATKNQWGHLQIRRENETNWTTVWSRGCRASTDTSVYPATAVAVLCNNSDQALQETKFYGPRNGTDLTEATNTTPLSLAAYSGQVIYIRFVYNHKGGNYFNQTSNGVGWHIDNITLTNLKELTNPVLSTPSASTAYTTTYGGSPLLVRMRAIAGGRYLPFTNPWFSGTGPAAAPIPNPPLNFRFEGM